MAGMCSEDFSSKFTINTNLSPLLRNYFVTERFVKEIQAIILIKINFKLCCVAKEVFILFLVISDEF